MTFRETCAKVMEIDIIFPTFIGVGLITGMVLSLMCVFGLFMSILSGFIGTTTVEGVVNDIRCDSTIYSGCGISMRDLSGGTSVIGYFGEAVPPAEVRIGRYCRIIKQDTQLKSVECNDNIPSGYATRAYINASVSN